MSNADWRGMGRFGWNKANRDVVRDRLAATAPTPAPESGVVEKVDLRPAAREMALALTLPEGTEMATLASGHYRSVLAALPIAGEMTAADLGKLEFAARQVATAFCMMSRHEDAARATAVSSAASKAAKKL